MTETPRNKVLLKKTHPRLGAEIPDMGVESILAPFVQQAEIFRPGGSMLTATGSESAVRPTQ